MKKKILFIIGNMEIGGIQKALISLLETISDDYDVTVNVLSGLGVLYSQIPSNVNVVQSKSLYRYWGGYQKDCKRFIDYILRAFLVLVARFFGTDMASLICGMSICKDKLGKFDYVVSYCHLGKNKTIFGGTGEYALSYSKQFGGETCCYIHCDYKKSGLADNRSKNKYRKFDKIICVSNGTKESFISQFVDENYYHQIVNKTYSILNAVNLDTIISMASLQTIDYDSNKINLISIARLTHEKGIMRALKVLQDINPSNVNYYVLGDGDEMSIISDYVRNNRLEWVQLVGEVDNPYRYLKNADILLVPSYHEAAPVVFQEAIVLGVPIVSTKTLSAEEIICENGWICENSDNSLKDLLKELLCDKELILRKKGNVHVENGKSYKKKFREIFA